MVDYTDFDNYAVAKAVNELGIHVLLDVNGYTGEGVSALLPSATRRRCSVTDRCDRTCPN